jgi:hypothetical protein
MDVPVFPRLAAFGKGKKGVVPGAILTLVVLGSVALILVPWRTALVVQTPKATVFCAAMTEGEEWMISYTHSVNRRPVYDFLRIEGKGIRILRSRYDAFGAGMPDTSTPEHPLRIGPDGWLEFTVNRWVPDLTIRVGRVAGHVLHIKGRAIPFDSLAEPGTALRFSAERRSLYQWWKGRCAW